MLEVELIADYLIENSYVSSERDAYEFIPHMSDYWLGSLLESSELQDLYERRKYKAVEDEKTGKLKKVIQKKDPLFVPGKGRVVKSPEGKLSVIRGKNVNPRAWWNRAKFGKNPDPRKPVLGYRQHLTTDIKNPNHPHGSQEFPGENKGGAPAGVSRGIRKNRQAKQAEKVSPETHPGTNITKYSPAGRIYQARLDAQAKKESQASQFGLYGNRR
jgi:hypothetical protein